MKGFVAVLLYALSQWGADLFDQLPLPLVAVMVAAALAAVLIFWLTKKLIKFGLVVLVTSALLLSAAWAFGVGYLP